MTDCIPQPRGSSWPKIGLIVLILVAAGTRMIGLGSLTVWEDEISHVGTSEELVGLLMRWQTTGAPEAAPLPWIELKAVRQVMGSSTFAMRFPSALYGAATAVLLYLILRRYFGWQMALAAALLLAVHPFWLEWTRQTKMYGHSLFFTTLAVGIALDATHPTNKTGTPWNDWRWWCLGFAFMLMHACNPQLIVVIGGIGLWLGIVALAHLVQRKPGGMALILGPLLAAGVYLCSWAATGIGKLILMLDRKSLPAENRVRFGETMQAVASELSGYLPLSLAILLWALAATGLIVMAKQGYWRIALLVVIVGLAPIASFPLVASKHFFATRYVIPALPAFCIGLTFLGSRLWQMHRAGSPRVKSVVAGVAILLLGASWMPAWREIYTVPRMAVDVAIAPLQKHASAPEVIVMIPDWHVNLTSYKPYAITSSPLVRPPHAARITVRTEADTVPGGSLKPFDADFYALFSTAADAPKPPPATWLLLCEPARYLPAAEELLAAYGLNTPEHKQEILRLSEGAATITMRLSPGKIDQVTTTAYRKYAK